MALQCATTKLLAPKDELSGALRGYFKGPRLTHTCSLTCVWRGAASIHEIRVFQYFVPMWMEEYMSSPYPDALVHMKM